ncbi:MAG TPA: DUF1707 domain-containing protein [Chloroflexota bacterium]|nr:DUF1707 domain-containing protein [Chloroflexota bacterium]
MNQDDLLVGDAERNQSVTVLREACAHGRLTLDEFSDRVNQAFAARTRGQLTSVTSDIPASTAVALPGQRAATHWTVTLLSDNKRNGHWRVDEQTRALTVMGCCTLDLRRAQVQGRETVVYAYVVMGCMNIIVPEGTQVELEGLTIMGSQDCKVADDRVLPGAPVVRVRGVILMGSVSVKTR